MAPSDTLNHRLDALCPAIEALMRLGGTPGLSLAVVDGKDDNNVYYANFGVRDIASGQPVTPETRFPACSLAKAVSAAAMGILVDEGKASWDMLARDAVSSFACTRDPSLAETTTLADLFSHRSGMSSAGALVGGSEGNVLVATQADMLRVVNEQVLLPERRGKYCYNSTAYDLVGAAIENLSQQSTVAAFVDDRIFQPLGLQRSSMEPPPIEGSDDNTCSCYNVLDNGTPVCIPAPRVGENGVGTASGGLWTCTSDLVKLYRAMLRSYHGAQDTPLRGISNTMAVHVAMPGGDTAYGLGWVRTRLPNTLGQIGLNGRLLPDSMPTAGHGLNSRPLIVYHQGTLPGALACAVLLPETSQVVVVLGNALALTDVPDWVVHLVVEELLGVPQDQRVDVFRYARQSIVVNLAWYNGVTKGLASATTRRSWKRPLESYVGTYVDKTGVFRVVVTLKEKQLAWAFQGLDSERYVLTHYDGDTFTWLQTRNELVSRGRWVLGDDCSANFWKVVFCAHDAGSQDTINAIQWEHDPAMPPIEYRRCISQNDGPRCTSEC
ncbi:hypothetical protein SBRCBS47491_000627 [Sporothrix bragantina]|uniref:Beta-lactamase-related domain-containing protein n=1 Tax=Sporothrix bragantina TaxID=671064 RepID=A0ABP0ARZ8_9PEZI